MFCAISPGRTGPARAAAVLGCLSVLLLTGCGSGSSADSTVVRSHPAPAKGKFPSAKGKTLAEVLESAGAHPSNLVVSPGARVFNVGENRYPFAVAEPDGTQVLDAEVALYMARVPGKGSVPAGGELGDPKSETSSKAPGPPLDEPADGPHPAAVETLQTKPMYRAKTTAEDADSALVVYSTQLDFPRDGEWQIAALIREGDRLTSVVLPNAVVGAYRTVPRVGQKAPFIHTLTRVDVGSVRARLTTRVPPDTLSEFDYASVLGKKPIMLLFSSPRFCQSHVCGPVVDVTEQVSHAYPGKAYFLHSEIYNEDKPSKGVRPQVRAYHLPSEPWLFVVDRQGRIEAEIEGAFGVEELIRLVKRAG